mmetsp:Transcript_63860/g.157140  ORF Transcript_63860/g.157140 Transcript_63860/m.157140 type:complete len:438 (+) Transcript_63860:257-1570(+)|eukprot:CAMPEP_0206216486 /NCGR_PEP_ID=MMETSP0047_2-20121206/2745_1 /ASSEMBLY_ACC=CAM_ASM_000192 /TAXON_ID=195065 /ORGANISM="Chroomonas mesostigmatica_cf, Strain CCMP1168" /LENGTH=437 /DNA_ID=CAMNT_0053638833 /DNA_START=226 /DNA_END=1539 /DNA_ORIENTATION=+
MAHTELLVTGGILSVVLSAIFAAVFNPLPPKPGVVGIDLGTTYSVIALFHNGSVEVVPDHEHKNLTPSVVAFTEDNQILVGYPARDYGVKHPESVVFDAKRLIGHRYNEKTVQHDQEFYPFDVVDVNGSAHIRVPRKGKELVMSPESVGAHVLRKLKKQVEKYIGRPVVKAVLAVPADFTEEQRNATIAAGESAGLEVLRIISEPTAAALAYGLQQIPSANILVYDFGGGTLDVSLLSLDGGVFEVVSACGDEHLGGEDFNQGLLEFLLDEFKKETGEDASHDAIAVDQLRRQVEAAKIALSNADEARVSLSNLYKGKDFSRVLTREQAEKIWGDLFVRAMWPIEQVLELAEYTREEVNQIVLVGGTTRMPRVREMVGEYFGKEPNWSVDPDQAVAWGTAVQAGILTDAKGIKVAATEYWNTGSKRCIPRDRPTNQM